MKSAGEKVELRKGLKQKEKNAKTSTRKGDVPCSTIQHQKNKIKKSICPPFSNFLISTSFSSPFSTLTWFCFPVSFLIWIWLHLRSLILYPSLLFQPPKKPHSLKGIKYAFRSLALEANHICAHEGDVSQCCQLPSVQTLINKEPLLQNLVGFWANPAEHNRIIQHLSPKLHLSPEWSFHHNPDVTHAAPPRFQKGFKALD